MPRYYFPSCSICDAPASLETCKIDEYGLAVHEQCYVERVAPTSRRKTRRHTDVKPRRNSALAVTTIRVRVRRDFPLNIPQNSRWGIGLAAIAAVLAIVFWTANMDHRHAAVMDASALQRSNVAAERMTLGRAALERANSGPKRHVTPVATEAGDAVLPTFKRVRVSPTEVDYIADDVIVRSFTDKPASSHQRDEYKQVHFGDDVTVRYFAPRSLPAETAVARQPSR